MKNTRVTKRLFQVLSLIFVLVAVSACSKKEGSKASVRRQGGRTGTTITGPNQIPNAPHGAGQIYNATQYSVADFLGADVSEIGQIQRIYLNGYVSDGYNNTQVGGYVEIRIQDSFGFQNGGDILVRMDRCDLSVQGSYATVTCEDDYGYVQFQGQATRDVYTGTVMYETQGQRGTLGNFNVPTCALIENGCR